MNCNYCEERLSDYLENALDSVERETVESHLLSCESCTSLLDGVRTFLQAARELPMANPPLWLPGRIVANTPLVVRLTWGDWLRTAWGRICEPRFAMTLLSSILVLGWMGNLAGISPPDGELLRNPTAIYYGFEGWANRVYGDAVRTYYSSPIVNAIQCQIHTRLEQFRENS